MQYNRIRGYVLDGRLVPRVWAFAAIGLVAANASAQASMVPEWLGRESEVLRGHREASLAGTEALFGGAGMRVPTPTLSSALLFCHVVAREEGPHGRWDTFADPDLRVVLRAGRFRSAAWGTENSREAWVSFAGVTIDARTRIDFELWDRDVTGDERMATLRGAYAGTLPLTIAQDGDSVTCTAAEPERVRTELDAALGRAEPIVALVEAARPDLTDAAAGSPTSAIDAAAREVATAMGWGGLHEPRAVAMRDRLTVARTAFDRALRGVVTVALRTPTAAPIAVPGGASTVRYVGVITSPAAIRAAYPGAPVAIPSVVELAIDPPATDPGLVLGAPDAIDARGNVLAPLGIDGHATEPGRFGLSFSSRLRPGSFLVRVGIGARTSIVPPR